MRASVIDRSISRCLDLTLYLIGFQVEVLQGGGHRGDACQFVVGQVQFHQGREVEGLRVNVATFQERLAQAKVLEVDESQETVLIEPRQGVVGQIELLQ